MLVISFTDLARDPRVDRQLRYLREGFHVVAAGTAPPAEAADYISLPALFPNRTARLRHLARLAARVHERSYWSLPAIRASHDALRSVEADLVVANELEALPLALSLGKPVLFDAHEYSPLEFEDSFRWRQTWGPYARRLCARYIPQVAAMTTVSASIAQRYAREYGVRCEVIRNVPEPVDLKPSPVGGTIRLLHHGGADPSRRLETMIEVMRGLDERFTLDFVLTGSQRYVARLRRKAGGDPRISFREPVPMTELIGLANDYDIGLYLLDPGAFNRLNALPNKFFEFVQARLGVATGPSPEMAALVEEWGFGVVSESFRPASLASRLSALDAASVAALKDQAHLAARSLNAQVEMPRFVEVASGALAAAG